MIPATRDEFSAPFFDAAAEGTLMIRRCTNCGRWVAPALMFGGTAGRCPACHQNTLEWAAAAGYATLVTWTILPDQPSVTGADHPQITGMVELQEGPWMITGIDVPASRLATGTPLEVAFARPFEGEPVPVFRTFEDD